MMPDLACAVAAEQLIAVFQTHKKQLRKYVKEGEKTEARQRKFSSPLSPLSFNLKRISDTMSGLDEKHVEKLKEAYGEVFDRIDHDKSGHIDADEMTKFLEMAKTQIDVEDLKRTIFGGEDEFCTTLTREKFTDIMCKKVRHH